MGICSYPRRVATEETLRRGMLIRSVVRHIELDSLMSRKFNGCSVECMMGALKNIYGRTIANAAYAIAKRRTANFTTTALERSTIRG